MTFTRCFRWAGLLVTCSLFFAAGCGGDDDETTPVTPPGGPPKVRITAIRTSSGPSFEVGSGAMPVVEAGCDPRKTLGVDLAFEFFTRRPPGACAGTLQCGSVVVKVDGPGGKTHSVQSTAISVPVPLDSLPFEPGEHTFTVELRDDANQPIAIAGAVPSDTVTVDVRASTSCGSDGGGADAGGDGADTGPETDAGDASDAPPDVSGDAASDSDAGAEDAATDQNGRDGSADAEHDQG